MRRIAPILSLALFLMLAPAAEARWFPFEAVDGPAARPVVDLGIEEGGGLVYVKDARAWLSQLGPRGWTAAAALSAGGTTEAAVAAGDRGRLAVAWIQGGIVYGALVGGPTAALSAGGGAESLTMEMGVNGVAYAVWGQGGDVRAARLSDGNTWEAVPVAVDVDPARAAGAGALRPKVAVAADGSALVVWGEVFADGVSHVLARRIYGTTLSALPQDASAGLGGRPTRRTSTSSTTARTRGSRSGRTSGAPRTASRAGCGRRRSRRRTRSTGATPAPGPRSR